MYSAVEVYALDGVYGVLELDTTKRFPDEGGVWERDGAGVRSTGFLGRVEGDEVVEVVASGLCVYAAETCEEGTEVLSVLTGNEGSKEEVAGAFTTVTPLCQHHAALESQSEGYCAGTLTFEDFAGLMPLPVRVGDPLVAGGGALWKELDEAERAGVLSFFYEETEAVLCSPSLLQELNLSTDALTGFVSGISEKDEMFWSERSADLQRAWDDLDARTRTLVGLIVTSETVPPTIRDAVRRWREGSSGW